MKDEATSHSELDAVRDAWNANAAVWSDGVRAKRDSMRAAYHDPTLFSMIGDISGMCILDIGCGEGITARALGKAGATVVGLDVSTELIARARNSAGDRVRYVEGSFTAIEDAIPNERFDLVISVMALMDSPDLEATAKAVRLALKPGGRFIFSVMHPLFTSSTNEFVENETAVLMRDYFDRTMHVSQWSFHGDTSVRPFSIPTFPRTIGDYVNELADADLRIVRIEEPQPSDEAIASVPRLARYTKFPFYLFIEAEALDESERAI
jgi:2-polyprenyl-3-methyl-5-hydroxy-6-metoxy-1,4-benzoquinol methylase